MSGVSLLESIGNTPLLRIEHLDTSATILAKAEYRNPGGSIKDRIAAYMIERALERGTITPETTLVEPTSGNTGIGLAMVCAARRINLVLTMPESMSLERRKLLEHLGARIVLTPAELGMGGSIDEAHRLIETLPEAYMLGQFTNPDNPETHYRTTAEEIVRDVTEGVDVFVAAVGTGGTLSGIGRRLREVYPEVRIVAVEPTASAVLSGSKAGAHAIQGIGAGFVPDVLEIDLIDEIITVTDDEAIAYARAAARQGGLNVGISSGANLAAARRLAQRPEYAEATLVTILPDGADRYGSTELFGRA
jgi:cysteine synthase A